MLLRDLKTFLHEHTHVSVTEVAEHFQIQMGLAQQMMYQFLQQGYIEKAEKPMHCGSSCHRCSTDMIDFYRVVKDKFIQQKETAKE